MLLSSAPIVATNTTWQPLTRDESDLCETAWQQLSSEEKMASLHIQESHDVRRDETRVGIPVSRDRLFEVDIISLQVCTI